MTPASKIEENFRYTLSDKLGDLAVSHHDYLYNVDTPYKLVFPSGNDTHKIFLDEKLTEIESKTLLCRELIEIDQRIRFHSLQYYLNYASVPQRIGFYHECTAIKQWLNTDNFILKYENLPKVDDATDKMLKAFASFDLPLSPENEKFILVQTAGNPLHIAVLLHKVHMVKALLQANAPINEAMLQFAIVNTHRDVFNDLVESGKEKIKNCLLNVLQFNLKNPHTLLTAEMFQTMQPYIENPIKLWEMAEFFSKANRELLSAVIPYLDIEIIRLSLEYAATKGLIEMATLFLANSIIITKMISSYPNEHELCRFLRIARDNNHHDVAKLFLKNNIELFLAKHYSSWDFHSAYNIEALDKEARSRYNVTQAEVADHILTKAKNTRQDWQGITVIESLRAIVKNADSHVHVFLRGTVVGRLRNKLIEDLESEIQKIQSVIDRSNNEGTSSRVNYQAPVAVTQQLPQDAQDIELPELKKNTINS